LKRIVPSAIDAEDDSDDDWRPARSEFVAMNDPAMNRARDRGRLAHRLLQSLPDIDRPRRADAGRRYLDAFAQDWSEQERAALLAEVMAVMDEPAFAHAFAEGSRAEVEIAGRIATATGEATVAGRIDRLAVSGNDVLIVDYKTNHPAPAEPPDEYVGQLAVYRALLKRIYPGKNVAAAILWTDGPTLVPLSDDMLNQAESALSAG
jgi:ATP-dependent helicase/nuclease subunit A